MEQVQQLQGEQVSNKKLKMSEMTSEHIITQKPDKEGDTANQPAIIEAMWMEMEIFCLKTSRTYY